MTAYGTLAMSRRGVVVLSCSHVAWGRSRASCAANDVARVSSVAVERSRVTCVVAAERRRRPPKPDAGRARALSLSRFLRRCVHGCRVVSCPLWPRVSCQIEIKLERVVDLGPFKHKVD